MGIPKAVLTSTLVKLRITQARLTSMRRGPIVITDTFKLGFPPYEHKYSSGITDICTCETQYYQGKTYINAGDL